MNEMPPSETLATGFYFMAMKLFTIWLKKNGAWITSNRKLTWNEVKHWKKHVFLFSRSLYNKLVNRMRSSVGQKNQKKLMKTSFWHNPMTWKKQHKLEICLVGGFKVDYHISFNMIKNWQVDKWWQHGSSIERE